MKNSSRLIPVKQFAKTHPWPSESGLRHLIFNCNDNGFDRVLKRVGRRILIDEEAFYKWVDNQNQQDSENKS